MEKLLCFLDYQLFFCLFRIRSSRSALNVHLAHASTRRCNSLSAIKTLAELVMMSNDYALAIKC